MRFLAVVVLVLALLAAVPAAASAANVLKVTPGTVNFGSKPVGSSTVKATTITNASDEAISLSLTLVRSWDDFAGPAGESTCAGFDRRSCNPEKAAHSSSGFPSETFLRISRIRSGSRRRPIRRAARCWTERRSSSSDEHGEQRRQEVGPDSLSASRTQYGGREPKGRLSAGRHLRTRSGPLARAAERRRRGRACAASGGRCRGRWASAPLVLPAAIDIGEDGGDKSVRILLGQALAHICC